MTNQNRRTRVSSNDARVPYVLPGSCPRDDLDDELRAMSPALKAHGKLPLVLLAALALVCLATVYAPAAGRKNWALEVVPGLLMVAWMAAVYRKMPLSHLVYVGTLLHVLVLVYGGFYSYAHTPLGDWAKTAFGLSRNHYDRVGHFALGFFPALLTREVLLRKTPLVRGGWLAFLAWSVVFAIGAFWELIEWWTTLIVASDLGQAFLGSQGDVWDAQWDMFFVGVGALVALLFFSKLHDRSMARVPYPSGSVTGNTPTTTG